MKKPFSVAMDHSRTVGYLKICARYPRLEMTGALQPAPVEKL